MVSKVDFTGLDAAAFLQDKEKISRGEVYGKLRQKNIIGEPWWDVKIVDNQNQQALSIAGAVASGFVCAAGIIGFMLAQSNGGMAVGAVAMTVGFLGIWTGATYAGAKQDVKDKYMEEQLNAEQIEDILNQVAKVAKDFLDKANRAIQNTVQDYRMGELQQLIKTINHDHEKNNNEEL